MKDKKQSRTEALAHAPLFKLMLSMGIPTFIAQLINLLYNIVDRIYIGHIAGYGATALTGVGLCFPIITLITAFSMLTGAGGAPLAGIALGEGNKKQAEKILGNSCTMVILLAVILTVVFQIVKKPFLYVFGASDATYLYAGQYISLYLFGTIFVMITLGLNSYIMVQGESLIAMASILIGAIMNIGLDPLFIFVFGMGVRGAALGTILSQAASAVWILHFLTGKKAVLRLQAMHMHPDGAVMKRIVSLGISPFIMSATESLITVLFNRGAQIYGNDLYVGSITILQSVMQIVFTPLNGFTQGVQPIISYNYGAGNLQRVRKCCRRLIAITGLFCFAFIGLFILNPGWICGIFTTDGELLAICEEMLPIFLAGMLIFGVQSGSQSSFMALGMAKQSLFFALFRKVILLSPLAVILPKVMHSVVGIYYAEPISDAISAVCCVSVFLLTLRKLEKKERRS